MVRSVNRQLSRSSEIWLNLTRTLEPLEIDYFECLVASGENPLFLRHQVRIHDNMIRITPIPSYPLFIPELESLLRQAIHFVERLKWLDRAEAELNNSEVDEEVLNFAGMADLPVE